MTTAGTILEKFAQLWLHETERVYGDRLVSATDVSKFKGLLVAQAKKHFSAYNFAKFFANDQKCIIRSHTRHSSSVIDLITKPYLF